MDWTWLVLLTFLGLAAFRLTRLVVEDDFPPVRVPREKITGERHWDEDERVWRWDHEEASWPRHWLGDLVSCPWCASGWVSLALVLAVALLTPRDAPLVDWFLLWIASWAVGSVLAAKVG